MTVLSHPTPFGHTIFCDDIRHEVTGKTTIVGIYAADILIRQLPVTLPVFTMRVSYTERPGESTEPVQLKVFLPGKPTEPVIDAALPVEQMRAGAEGAEERLKPDDEETFGRSAIQATTVMDIRLTPFTLEKEGFIRVRAYRGDLEIRLGSLQVRVLAPTENIAGMAPANEDAPPPSS